MSGLPLKKTQKELKEEKPVLGICLGSQLLAAVLGASITRGPQKEIGWHSIDLLPAASENPLMSEIEKSFMGYHWHGDCFDLPKGASALASSERTACQAFAYGPKAYGILFHMEVTEQIIGDMVRRFDDEVREVLVGRLGTTIRVVVDRTRSQDRNRELALGKLEERLQEARVEQRRRRPTRPGRRAVERRLTAKKQRAARKSERRRDWRTE